MKRKTFFLLIPCLLYCSNLLKSQTIDSLDDQRISEIEITAYRIKSDLGKIPQQVKILTSSDFSSIPSRGFDETLKKMAAIDIIQYQGFNSVIGMRGFAPSGFGKANTLILIDGIPSGTSNLSTINLDNIKQIEILKGPYSAFFGSDAMGGLINLSTNQNHDKIKGDIGLSYGSFNTYKFSFNIGGAITRKLNFDFNASTMGQHDNYYTGNNNLLNLSDQEKIVMEEKSYGKEYQNTRYKKYYAGTRLGYQFSQNMRISADFSYWTAKDIENNGNFWASYPGQLQDIDRIAGSLTFEATSGRHQFRLSPHYSKENSLYFSDLSDSAFKNQQSVLESYGLIFQDAMNFGKLSLIVGIDNLSRKNTSVIWSAPDIEAVPYQPDYLNMANGLYIQANIKMLDQKLNASIGGRYDYIIFRLYENDLLQNQPAKEIYQTFNPNASLQYKMINGLKVHSAVGTAFVAPDAFKIAGNYSTGFGNYQGNPALEPESSVTYDVGIEFSKPVIGFYIDLTYFSTRYEKIIGYDFSNPAYITYKNANNAQMNGLEFEFQSDLTRLLNTGFQLKFYASYTHLFNSMVKVDSIDLDMKYVRKGKGSFGLDFETVKGLKARINARYIGERYEDNFLYAIDWQTWEKIPYTDANGETIRPALYNEDIIRMPDHLVFDLSVGYLFKKKYWLGVLIDNLFDENYSEKDMYYMPGRSIMASVNLKL